MASSQIELIEKLQAENKFLRERLGYDEKSKEYTPMRQDGIGGAANILRQQTPEEAIDFLFTFHDDPDKTPHYVEIRESAKQFAKVVVRHTPAGGPDRLTAIAKIREAVMFANACVALSGRGL